MYHEIRNVVGSGTYWHASFRARLLLLCDQSFSEGNVNVWNQCVSSLTGFSTLDVYGRKLVDEFVSIDFKDSVSDILKNALMGIETANFEFPLLTSGDHVVEVLLKRMLPPVVMPKITHGVVGTGQDITDARAKRDAEMKQRAAEAATAAQATISAHVSGV